MNLIYSWGGFLYNVITNKPTEGKKMTGYKIVNNITNECMERVDTLAEAKEVQEQYN